MSISIDPERCRFDASIANAVRDKRVLITGAGKHGGLGQAFAYACGLNGAASVGVHFHSSYDDGLETVENIRRLGRDAFPVQADVTNARDIWAIRTHCINKMGGPPNVVICNSGRSETGYLLGRVPRTIENEAPARRRARVRKAFIENLAQSSDVIGTKLDGFLTLSHLWASEAVHKGEELTIIYISSRQAVDPGAGVPGYCAANWAVLCLPEVLRVNLGRHASRVTAFNVCYPFVVTGMTQSLKDNPKVFGRWQPRMLETDEAAKALLALMGRPNDELRDRTFQLNVDPAPAHEGSDVRMRWAEVALSAETRALDWNV